MKRPPRVLSAMCASIRMTMPSLPFTLAGRFAIPSMATSRAREKYREAILKNISIAPMLLEAPEPPRGLWYPNDRAEPNYAAEFIDSYAVLWDREPGALRILREVWQELQPRVAEIVDAARAHGRFSGPALRAGLQTTLAAIGGRRRAPNHPAERKNSYFLPCRRMAAERPWASRPSMALKVSMIGSEARRRRLVEHGDTGAPLKLVHGKPRKALAAAARWEVRGWGRP